MASRRQQATKGKQGVCYKHLMHRAAVDGWFVCTWCGLPAACPGCVPPPPVHIRFYLCDEHSFYEQFEGVAARLVWATTDSSK